MPSTSIRSGLLPFGDLAHPALAAFDQDVVAFLLQPPG